MSEYQSYEFVATDRQLTGKEMAELRSISTRAEITPTRIGTSPTGGRDDSCFGCRPEASISPG